METLLRKYLWDIDGLVVALCAIFLARAGATVVDRKLLAATGPALTFLGVSAYWERAIPGAIILVAVAADGIRHPMFRRLAGVDAGARG